MEQEEGKKMLRSDDDPNRLRIVRDVPLWGIIMLVLGGAGQGVALYYGQQAGNRATVDLKEIVLELRAEIRELRIEFGIKNMELSRHEQRISDHDRRITALEQRR